MKAERRRNDRRTVNGGWRYDGEKRAGRNNDLVSTDVPLYPVNRAIGTLWIEESFAAWLSVRGNGRMTAGACLLLARRVR